MAVFGLISWGSIVKKRVLMTVAAALGVSALSTAPAVADSSVRDEIHFCTVQFGIRACQDSVIITNTKTTKGDVFVSTVKTDSEFTLQSIEGGSLFFQSNSEVFHATTTKGVNVVFKSKGTQVFTVDGIGCTFSNNFVLTNGVTRHDDPTVVCTPPPGP